MSGTSASHPRRPALRRPSARADEPRSPHSGHRESSGGWREIQGLLPGGLVRDRRCHFFPCPRGRCSDRGTVRRSGLLSWGRPGRGAGALVAGRVASVVGVAAFSPGRTSSSSRALEFSRLSLRSTTFHSPSWSHPWMQQHRRRSEMPRAGGRAQGSSGRSSIPPCLRPHGNRIQLRWVHPFHETGVSAEEALVVGGRLRVSDFRGMEALGRRARCLSAASRPTPGRGGLPERLCPLFVGSIPHLGEPSHQRVRIFPDIFQRELYSRRCRTCSLALVTRRTSS